MSSSMRNAIQRRPYRERAQPEERQKWGILEKHKDYSLRARNHRAQRDQLKRLRGLARERNPDEFYFSMMKSRMSRQDGTRLGDRGNKSLGVDAVRLLKTQDMGYLRVVGEKARREAERLKEAEEMAVPATGVVEEEEEEEEEGRNGRRRGEGKVRFAEGLEERGEEVARLRRLSTGERGKREGTGESEDEDGDLLARQRESEREKRKKRTEAARRRYAEIEAAERELDEQRARMAKHRSVGGTNSKGVKWRIRERKK
ncbi:MAG: hypothetical protein M1837_000538 [Sclerophora amabilis]|nr:MAG: hypothetical protein M1837_000538 [Sclerophora amabilis]